MEVLKALSQDRDRVQQCMRQRQLWSYISPAPAVSQLPTPSGGVHFTCASSFFKRQERLSVVIFKALSLDRVRRLLLELKFVVEVSRALSLDRVFNSSSWSCFFRWPSRFFHQDGVQQLFVEPFLRRLRRRSSWSGAVPTIGLRPQLLT